jgi:hypothetical protein
MYSSPHERHIHRIRILGLGANIANPAPDASVGNPIRTGWDMRRYVLAFSLVGLTFFALAHDAAADLLAEVSFNGGAFVPICTALPGGTCVGSVAAGGLVLNMAAAQSNSPGNLTLVAVLLSSAVSLMNTNMSGTATAHLLIGDTSWAVPTGAVTMLSHIGGTVAVGGPLNTMAFFSSFDPGSEQNVSPGTFDTPAVSPNISARVPTTRRAQSRSRWSRFRPPSR